MPTIRSLRCATFVLLSASLTPAAETLAQDQASIASAGQVPIVSVHAQGAQVYQCKADNTGKLVWQFREPVAVLMEGGRTIGRHYAGPTWELDDGSRITGRVVARSPGATAGDIPLLKLEVVSRAGPGRFKDAVTVQRLNTSGGIAEGGCDTTDALLSVPYSADYAILKPAL